MKIIWEEIINEVHQLWNFKLDEKVDLVIANIKMNGYISTLERKLAKRFKELDGLSYEILEKIDSEGSVDITQVRELANKILHINFNKKIL